MLRSPQEIINEIIEITKGEKYIFRGESKDYSELGGRSLASNIYRQFCLPSKNGPPPIENEYFSILKVEKDIIDKAKEHLPYGASNIDILTQLQHYGGKTALIDFTYNLHIALFFACEKNLSEDGKLFMFPSERFHGKNNESIEQDILMMPTGKDPRIIFQSSVFVHTHKGYIAETAGLLIISYKEKEDILTYLRKNFNIHAGTIYNDMYGFIKNLENHSTAEIEFYRGMAWHDKESYEEAIKSYDKAIKINPQFIEAYNNRGVAKKESGDKTGALLDYDKAIEINPQYADAYNNRGNAKFALGDTTGALLDYDKAIEINPQYAKAYYNRGIVKINPDDKKDAEQDLLQAKKLAEEQNLNDDIENINKVLQKLENK